MGFGVSCNSSEAAPRIESENIRNMIFFQVIDKQGKQLRNVGDKMRANTRWGSC